MHNKLKIVRDESQEYNQFEVKIFRDGVEVFRFSKHGSAVDAKMEAARELCRLLRECLDLVYVHKI